MAQMKTPGVYIVEKNAFPNSVVQVPTAVPAFIGYTERASFKGKSLTNKPTKITSMAEYLSMYGEGPRSTFAIAENTTPDTVESDFSVNGKEYTLTQDGGNFLLYNSIRLFFANGGGPCYIISVGDYSGSVDPAALTKAIDLLVREQEPTMLVIPDAVLASDKNDCYSLQDAMVKHCGEMQSRIAILDIYDGYKAIDPAANPIADFRNGTGTNYVDYSCAYYPWLETTIVPENEISFQNVSSIGELQTVLRDELGDGTTPLPDAPDGQQDDLINAVNELATATSDEDVAKLNKTLIAVSPVFNVVLKEVRSKMNLLPPAAAMAGIYTMVDNTRGVHKAPANVSVSSVISPAVNITHYDQQDLNVTLAGKSVNAIRSFIGQGTLVWGARTLDGNSQDWRYINVRRTMIMIEQSIKSAAKAYVFEPNDANTWVSVKSMIYNFLTSQWKSGALVGASPDDAFSVSVGLGSTMTANDILDGIMRVTVLVAVSRPAEFIEITFQQQMQKS